MPGETVINYGDIVRAVSGEDPDTERKVWHAWREGTRKWLLRGEQIPLDQFLPGVAGMDRQRFKIAERNMWLCRAHALCAGPTTWARSVALAKEVGDFDLRLWPAWRLLEEPPSMASELRRALFQAFKIASRLDRPRGNNVPNTAEALHGIVKSQLRAISLSEAQDSP